MHIFYGKHFNGLFEIYKKPFLYWVCSNNGRFTPSGSHLALMQEIEMTILL
jgi:hypothetical protein